MADVRLSGVLPGVPNDGLSAFGSALVDRPDRTLTVVGVLKVASITENLENGESTPTVRFLSLEVIDGGDEEMVRRAMFARRESRTGTKELPIDDAPAQEPEVEADDEADEPWPGYSELHADAVVQAVMQSTSQDLMAKVVAWEQEKHPERWRARRIAQAAAIRRAELRGEAVEDLMAKAVAWEQEEPF